MFRIQHPTNLAFLVLFQRVHTSLWFWTIHLKLSLIAKWRILIAIFHELLGFPLANQSLLWETRFPFILLPSIYFCILLSSPVSSSLMHRPRTLLKMLSSLLLVILCHQTQGPVPVPIEDFRNLVRSPSSLKAKFQIL